MTWVYKRTEPQLWTVGYYAPDGSWEAESDHSTPEKAAERVRWLNGGDDPAKQFTAAEVRAKLERLQTVAENLFQLVGYEKTTFVTATGRLQEVVDLLTPTPPK